MYPKYILPTLLCGAAILGITACGDDVIHSHEGDQFTTVSSLNDADCSEETEGSMAFVKSKATMYVCSEGEWVAMNDQEAIQYRCESKALEDKSGFAIICDGDTIGVVYNGKNGTDGKNGADGAKGANGADGAKGTSGKSIDTAAVQKALDASQSKIEDALKALSSASVANEKNLNDKFSSAASELDNKFNTAYSSLSAEHRRYGS